MSLQLVTRTGHPTFLDLPWERPLEEWESERLVSVERGISRHVVRFAAYGDTVYALKELPRELADREYTLLTRLRAEQMPVVEAVGVVGGRPHDLDAVLITRHLDFSLPYRSLFGGRGFADLGDRLLDALAHLLVRLHLAGFFWGDCSLSNALFRRDAGALSAYLVDAETGELHPALSAGQRRYDVSIAEENVGGELYDVEAELGTSTGLEPAEVAAEVGSRYEALWAELTHEERFGVAERFRIDERLRRLNELGYDVEELELAAADDGTFLLRLDPRVVEPGHHRRRLGALTGLDVQENQARRLLQDVAAFRAMLERAEGVPVPEAVAAQRWLREVFEPTIEAVPDAHRGKLEPAEMFHEILVHRWYLSESRGRDVGLGEAARSYATTVLSEAPEERRVLGPSSSDSL
jgi:hypothetical protein